MDSPYWPLWLLIGFVASQLLNKFFPSYFMKKGENLATKEDVAEITHRIESVKNEYQVTLERHRSAIQIEAATKNAFRLKSIEAIEAIDSLLVQISMHCWKELSERSPNEHYVWSNVSVPEDIQPAGFHYYRVAIDRAAIEHGLFLSNKAKKSLSNLANQIGLLSSMERYLSDSDPDPAIIESAENGYETGLKAVDKCRAELMEEFGLE